MKAIKEAVVQAYEVKQDIKIGGMTVFFSKKDDGWILPGGHIEKSGGVVTAKLNSMIRMSSNAARVSKGV